MRRLKKPPRSLRLSHNEATDLQGNVRGWASTKATKNFRKELTNWCIKNHQGRCSYCSLEVGVDQRRSKALDHFVPKSKRNGVPAWTYETYNLLLSCDSCNSVVKKSVCPVTLPASASYRRLTFSLFHPYLDHVEDHIEGGYRGGRDVPSTPRSQSEKGRRTIELFGLDSPGLRSTWEGERLRSEIEYMRAGWGGAAEDLYAAALRELSGRDGP